MRITKRTARKEAIQNGFRSNFEFNFFKKIESLKLNVQYETDKLVYIQPEKKRNYLPDWKIKPKTYIETKGIFSSTDRQKILFVIKCNPEVKLYMLFQNSKLTLNKKSKTTYSDWCDKMHIEWADIKNERKWRQWFE